MIEKTIVVRDAVDGLGRTHPIAVVGVGNARPGAREARQLARVRPRQRRAVSPVSGIAEVVVGFCCTDYPSKRAFLNESQYVASASLSNLISRI